MTSLLPFGFSQITLEAYSYSVFNYHTQIFLCLVLSHLVLFWLVGSNNFHYRLKPSAIKLSVCFHHSCPHAPCTGRTGHYLYLDNASSSCVSREFHQLVPAFYTQDINENVK